MLKYKIINFISRKFMTNTLRPQIKTVFRVLILLASLGKDLIFPLGVLVGN